MYKAHMKRWKHMDTSEIESDEALIDVMNLTRKQQEKIYEIGNWKWNNMTRPILAFDNYGSFHSGFYLIPQALSTEDQLALAYSCLTEYCEPPHVTNMHSQSLQETNIWDQAYKFYPQDPAKFPALSKLHWAASGYHYDWTARKYYPEEYSPVPVLLRDLAVHCAKVCNMTIEPEAVIVNYYNKSSTMGGHQDDVEETMDHPVISVSLGCSAVFLKGGLSKDEKPLEVLLRSGDIAILGGNSRLSYHGIARVLPIPNLEAVEANKCSIRYNGDQLESFKSMTKYLKTHRININVRQVYPSNHLEQHPKPQTDS